MRGLLIDGKPVVQGILLVSKTSDTMSALDMLSRRFILLKGLFTFVGYSPATRFHDLYAVLFYHLRGRIIHVNADWIAEYYFSVAGSVHEHLTKER